MKKMTMVLVVFALIAMLAGCGFIREQVQPRVREGLLRLDVEATMLKDTGTALANAPESVTDEQKAQFLDRLDLMADLTYVLNVLVGSYDLEGFLESETVAENP